MFMTKLCRSCNISLILGGDGFPPGVLCRKVLENIIFNCIFCKLLFS